MDHLVVLLICVKENGHKALDMAKQYALDIMGS